MVVGGDHACQPAQGWHEYIESVFLGLKQELDALFQDCDGVGEVEGVEPQSDLILVASCLG